MTKRILLMIAALSLCLGSALPAQQTPPAPGAEDQKTLNLSLDECILKALKNNLDLAVQVMTPELSDLAVSLAKEKYYPTLSFGYTDRSTANASYSFLDSQGTTTQTQGNYTAALSQSIPLGGVITASLTAYNLTSNANFQTINPRYGSTLTFGFSQPLLKNFGSKIADYAIFVAKNNREISDLQFNQYVQNKIYEVEQDYWNLVYAIENLKVQQQSLTLARDLLEKNQRSVEIGTMAPLDVLNAQAEVAAREADILGGEALVKNSEDILRTVMNLAAEVQGASSVRIIPTSLPNNEPQDVRLEVSLKSAMDNRPDLAASKVDIQTSEFNLTYARNQLLPDLSLNAQYWSPGVSGTQLVYQDNDPLTGIVVSKIPGGASNSFNDTFNFKYKNWSVGLTLSVPISNVFSRASQAQARVNLNQSIMSLKSQEQQLFLELTNAVRTVQTNYKRVQAYKVSRELAQKRLEAEVEKLKVGKSTNYLVVQAQRDLATQQGLELKSIIDYTLSLASLETAEGLALKNRKIEISNWLKK